MNSWKKIAPVLIVCLCTISAFSQKEKSDPVPGKNNILKINLSALVVKNISVQYEVKVGKKTSVAANVHFIPFGKLPFANSINNAIDDPNVKFDQFKLGDFGFTPEFRFYLGKKEALQGFYLAPFLNYNNFKADLPLSYNNDTKTGVFSGRINSFTGGLQLGAQWALGKNIVLDWWIIGPNYGRGKGELSLATTLSQTEQDEIRNELNDLKNDEVIGKVIQSYTVNGNGAIVQAKGPWAGLRGLGFNLGFRF